MSRLGSSLIVEPVPRSPTAPIAADLLLSRFGDALAAARAHEGATAPNPPVGCVLLDIDGAVLAEAAHRRSGTAHAEAAALAACREAGTTESHPHRPSDLGAVQPYRAHAALHGGAVRLRP